MVNPFDLKTVLLAKHAQHVVLIHFPIALFITAVAFDLAAQWTRRRSWADAAYYNLVVAAASTLPVLATGRTRVAVPTRRSETEGHPVTALGTRVCFKRDDLAGVVAAFPRAASVRDLAELSPGD